RHGLLTPLPSISPRHTPHVPLKIRGCCFMGQFLPALPADLVPIAGGEHAASRSGHASRPVASSAQRFGHLSSSRLGYGPPAMKALLLSRRLRRTARDVFGWRRLRAPQLRAARALLRGRDALVILPTG